MDIYPLDYVQHNLPFVVLSGLEAKPELESLPAIEEVLPGKNTTTISSEIPPVTGERAQLLLQEFLNADGRDSPWNGRPRSRKGSIIGFRLRAIGREFTLPPRKADPPRVSDDISPPASPTIAPSHNWILHSPISPLTPGSPTFPDGIMSVAWLAKHQHYVPSVFISFFNFASDPNRNSLHDNQLKTEINKIKGQLQKSDYRIRYVVVLLSNKTILEAPDIEERLANIRRATGLDPKNSLFFLPPNTSRVELTTFVHSLLATLQISCVEYYRDLTKHARRKKGRAQIPPPTAPPTRGTSQTLPHQAWAVRYDFKLGAFAEFRQEMDAAQRHYGFVLEGLFGPDGVFETTASWSPRWDEDRLLADMTALRFIRCLLWNAMPTSAVQTWSSYKSRMRDMVDRRGKGTTNYGWEAWESRWAEVMAQLIQRAELSVFSIIQPSQNVDALTDRVNSLFAPAEKAFSIGERLPPWHLLHHPGYWLKLSAKHAKRRRLLAEEMSEEDRTLPNMSPATQVSHRHQMYDIYLVPEPHQEKPLPGVEGGFDHCNNIVRTLGQAATEYDARSQQRMVDQVHLETGKELLHAKRYKEAFDVVRPLWENMSWRKERWWTLVSEVTWALHECAFHLHNVESLILAEWELLSKVLRSRPSFKHNLMRCLDHFPTQEGAKPTVSVRGKDANSSVSVSFAFSEGEGNVGEPLQSQIVVASTARPGSAPITLSSLTIQFEGCLSKIDIAHRTGESGPAELPKGACSITKLTLEEEASSDRSEPEPRWKGSADLFLQPGETKVFDFPLVFREAGDVAVVGCSFAIDAERFGFSCSLSNEEMETDSLPLWWIQAGSRAKSKTMARDTGMTIKILPKPPKMEIGIANLVEQYYTDETIELNIEIKNNEEEDTEAVLEVRLLGRAKDNLEFSWISGQKGNEATSPTASVDETSSEVGLPGHVVGQLERNGRRVERIKFIAPSEPSDYTLEVKVLYHLLSDRDIPISKIFIADLIFVSPFEASYEFAPRVHPDPWPSFFSMQEDEIKEEGSTDAFGIASKWHLEAKIASFASEPLTIQDVSIDVDTIHGGAVCAISSNSPSSPTEIRPQELQDRTFSLMTQKLNLEERRPSALDMSLAITWSRTSADSQSITSHLPIPRLHIPSSEPRVLATAVPSPTVPSLVHLSYTLENPTMHFLTFELSMEASEEFGFSGPKLRVLNLLPLSRLTVGYNILAMGEGGEQDGKVKWVTPVLKVVDRYFNKNLKVLAGEGCRAERRGIGVWVGGGEK